MNYQSLLEKLPYRSTLFRIIIGCVMLFIVTGIVFLIKTTESTKTRWAEAKRGNFTIDLVESGEIRAVNSTFISAPRSWELQILRMVPEGAIVKPGDFLVTFDATSIEKDLESAKDSYSQLESDLKRVDKEQEARMSKLNRDLQKEIYSKESAQLRLEQLKFESKIRQEEAKLDSAKASLNFENIQQKIISQKVNDIIERQKTVLRLEQGGKNVEDLKKKIKSMTFTSPIGGMVVYREVGGWNSPKKRVDVGDKLRPEEIFLEISDLNKMKMLIQINEMDLNKLNVGQKVYIRIEAFDDTTYTGTVYSISPVIDKPDIWHWQGSRSSNEPPKFEIAVLIDGSDPRLKPGMTSVGKIITEEIPNVVYIPSGTIFETKEGETVVFTKKSYPKPVKVKIGERNNMFTIIKKGIGEKDYISWIPPLTGYHPLGWHKEMKRMEMEKQQILKNLNPYQKNEISESKIESTQLKK